MVYGNFWKKWESANEIEKEKLVKSLPMFKDFKCPLFSPGLINSYFEDLYLYCVMNHDEEK